MAGRVHKTLSTVNARRLIAGVAKGLPYREIGASYTPPVAGGTAYKHAKKMGITEAHPNHGKRAGPYTQNPREAFE